MKNIGSRLRFNRQERSGIFYLFCLVFAFQLIFYCSNQWPVGSTDPNFGLDLETQLLIDSLLALEAEQKNEYSRPYNPNYISDYKGYVLGMSPEEIDRLHRFRAAGNFVNSAEEFQKITGVSDSLYKKLSPNFLFPIRKFQNRKKPVAIHSESKKDLNKVGREELIQVNGVGEVLSTRIIKFRDALGGFLEDDQLNDVYGLEKRVVGRILRKYTVIQKPHIVLLDINSASEDELSKLVYISAFTARRIIRYRELEGGIDSLNELQNIPGFPTDKINRIKLYLTL